MFLLAGPLPTVSSTVAKYCTYAPILWQVLSNSAVFNILVNDHVDDTVDHLLRLCRVGCAGLVNVHVSPFHLIQTSQLHRYPLDANGERLRVAP